VYIADDFGRRIIETNQYAVTEQSHPSAGHTGQEVPGISRAITETGIFFKYDVEPLQVTILHTHTSFYRFLIRLVALVGGVVVCTEWAYKGFDALAQRLENKRGRSGSAGDGLLNGYLEKEG
jgi:hypothetical protein